MDHPKLKFTEFKFDSTSYSIAVNVYAKQITENNEEDHDNGDEKFHHMDLSINEKIQKCTEIAENIKKVQLDDFEMQMDMDRLKEEEEQLFRNNLDLKEDLKLVCESTFVRNNKIFRALAQKIQMNLGFKLKLMQCHDDRNMWTAKFLFDTLEADNNYFVVISYNVATDTFALCDMNPKHTRYVDFAEFLDKTNDITGFLYNCWKSFVEITLHD